MTLELVGFIPLGQFALRRWRGKKSGWGVLVRVVVVRERKAEY